MSAYSLTTAPAAHANTQFPQAAETALAARAAEITPDIMVIQFSLIESMLVYHISGIYASAICLK
jgi:hypothetical protein